MSIEISPRTRQLINQYQVACALNQQETPTATSIDYVTLLYWLDDHSALIQNIPEKSRQSAEFVLLLLRAQLLHDLRVSMEGEEKPDTAEESSTSNKMKLILLTCAGILVTASDGFDCVITIMSTFSLSSAIILASAMAFSLCSIIAFCGIELFKISSSMGVKLKEAHKLLDGYLQQFEEIKRIRKKIGDYNFSKLPKDELDQLAQLISLSQQRLAEIMAASDQFNKVLNSRGVQITKVVLSTIAATLFFGGAFCAGQTASLFILGLFITTITPASVPVLLFSLLVGLAALTLYWHLEVPGLKGLISGWFGLNEEKVEKLCNREALTKEEKKLSLLKEELQGTFALKEQLAQQEHVSPVTEEPVLDDESPKEKPKPSAPSVGTNIYSFMRPPRPPVEQLTPEVQQKKSCALGCSA